MAEAKKSFSDSVKYFFQKLWEVVSHVVTTLFTELLKLLEAIKNLLKVGLKVSIQVLIFIMGFEVISGVKDGVFNRLMEFFVKIGVTGLPLTIIIFVLIGGIGLFYFSKYIKPKI